MEPQQQQVQQLIWKSEAGESMMSVTIGRAMNTVLSSRPRKLQDAISRLSLVSNRTLSSLSSLEDSVWFLHKYIEDAAEKKEPLDPILIPIIEHSLKNKDSKHGGQAMILINWFFRDEHLFRALANDLANIFMRKDDHYVALGWCTLVRTLLEYESATYQYHLDGIREKYYFLLKILNPCISRMLLIICRGSASQDGFELPSRLSVSAADCLLVLTEALTKKADYSSIKEKSASHASDGPISSLLSPLGNQKEKPAISSLGLLNMEMEFILWSHLEDLIKMVQRLLAWSRKGRPLHSKGLELVLKWLQEIKGEYGCFENEAGSEILKTGALLLSSCWKHYSKLMHLEDRNFSRHYKEFIVQYLSGIQHCSHNRFEEHSGNKDVGVETRKFFLNCLCLLLGRFESKKFESIMTEYGMQISDVLLSQLHCTDEDVIAGTVCIFRAAVFNPNKSVGSSLTDGTQMDAVLTSLLHLLDERDGTARAAIMLLAEYCYMSTDSYCLQQVLMRIASGNELQRMNAIDVISELIHISSHSSNDSSHLAWKDLANHLLDLLGDEVIVIREQASNLLPLIEPSLVLPALVRLAYSPKESVQSSASAALTAVLKYHNQKVEVICTFLDCLSNINQSLDLPKATGDTREGSKFDTEKVLRLIPEWSKSVQVWDSLIGPLIDKMFTDPANATIVRFLSYISENLADAADEVLSRVLLQMKGLKEIDESFLSRWESQTSDHTVQQALFEHLCPLLVIRLLPLRVFDDLNSSAMYGYLTKQGIPHDFGDTNSISHESVAALLLSRALTRFEFEDVRKLAAELCGRIHPKMLFPIVASQLRQAVDFQDTWKIKACLFSVCTSLVVRGRDSIVHPDMLEIRKTMEMVLLWPSADGDEVSKAQHGCIDCLALMICAELQAVGSQVSNSEKQGNPESAATRNSVLTHVIRQLIDDKNEALMNSMMGSEKPIDAVPLVLSFRLCMANVLISACQKISDTGKKRFTRRTLPRLINSIEEIMHPDIRAACVHVLFSSVYHLKSAVLPCSSDLLKLSLNLLKKESEKERMAGAKLMASLMASEDAILMNISGGLLEARSILSNICATDPSLDLQQVCRKLMACVSFS